jgi:hypothetical protein
MPVGLRLLYKGGRSDGSYKATILKKHLGMQRVWIMTLYPISILFNDSLLNLMKTRGECIQAQERTMDQVYHAAPQTHSCYVWLLFGGHTMLIVTEKGPEGGPTGQRRRGGGSSMEDNNMWRYCITYILIQSIPRQGDNLAFDRV